jgi:hypothetical protein
MVTFLLIDVTFLLMDVNSLHSCHVLVLFLCYFLCDNFLPFHFYLFCCLFNTRKILVEDICIFPDIIRLYIVDKYLRLSILVQRGWNDKESENPSEVFVGRLCVTNDPKKNETLRRRPPPPLPLGLPLGYLYRRL